MRLLADAALAAGENASEVLGPAPASAIASGESAEGLGMASIYRLLDPQVASNAIAQSAAAAQAPRAPAAA
jgi:hypothetical protein